MNCLISKFWIFSKNMPSARWSEFLRTNKLLSNFKKQEISKLLKLILRTTKFLNLVIRLTLMLVQ